MISHHFNTRDIRTFQNSQYLNRSVFKQLKCGHKPKLCVTCEMCSKVIYFGLNLIEPVTTL